jgi:N-sulfoglucosamine sulfohydrolase
MSASAAAPLPNIIVFLLDDVGQRDVGAFGNPAVHTPNIDRLAAEGMRFDNAFLTTSSCSSSRASIMTGMYPTATGAPNLNDPLPADKISLPTLLRRAGYYTASIGKWHLGEPFKTQFDRVVEPREESGAADWLPELARRPPGKPFFFWLASKDAHDPYYWNPPLRHQDPSKVVVPSYAEDNAFTRQVMAGYYDEIARADENIGYVVAILRQQHLLDNTLVIVLSDNGSQIGGAKTTLYDEGIKTPLIMRFPPIIPPGTVNQQLVSVVDLMPTILQLAGLSRAPGAPGVSLLPTLQDSSQPVRSYIYAERNRHGPNLFERLVRTDRFSYKRNYLGRRLCNPYADTVLDPGIPRDAVYEEFYDLQRDPSARNNLVSEREYRDDLNSARQKMSVIMAETTQNPPPLIVEQCPLRPWHERIRWPFP